MTITSTAPPAARGDEPPLELVYEPGHELDVWSILGPLRRGAGDPCVRFADDGIWLALRTGPGEGTGPGTGENTAAPGGGATATLHVSAIRNRVRVRAWGSGAHDALDLVPGLLGAGDDWSGLDTTAHDLIASSAHRNPGLRLTRTGRVLDALAPAIIEQKITSTEAFRAWRILVTAHGEPAPGPAPRGMRVPPTAEAWRRIPSWEWHRAGVDPRRSKTVIQAATVARGLERTLRRHPGGDEVWRLLRTIPGVGPWTAAETAQRSHGDPDAVSFGDYHLAATIGWALVGEPIDDDALAELLEPWAGQRQRIVRLVLASGFRPPRHGPRMTIQDHRSH